MRLVIVLAAFICCVCTAPLKNELLQKATGLDNRLKIEINKLKAEKREHLALVLQEEEKRLQTLTTELKNVVDTDGVKKTVLEEQLIAIEYRLENEINILQREASTQELLESNAKDLKQWVTEEIKLLMKTGGPKKHDADLAANALKRGEQRLEVIAQELTKAQDQKKIEALEVELRAIEIRVFEALRAMHFKPSTGKPSTGKPSTGKPTTGTTKAHVTASRTTARHTSARPSTARPATAKTTVHVSTRPTVKQTTKHVSSTHASVKPTSHVTKARATPTTLSPIKLKDILLKRATQLDLNVKSEIAKLKRENRMSQSLPLQTLNAEVIRISERLQKTSQTDILQLLESELFWLESRLSIEIQALQAQDERVERLMSIAGALKQRIVAVLKGLANTPVGNALVGESRALDSILAALKNAKDDKTLDDMELQLTLVEKRVNNEVTPIVVPTPKPF